MKAVLVTQSSETPTAGMFLLGIRALNQTLPEAQQVEVEVKSFGAFGREGAAYDPESTLVFVAVSEAELSYPHDHSLCCDP